jgi:dCMP deaminase
MTDSQSDKYYMSVAILAALNSHAIRKKVGAIIVKDNCIVSDGFNGTPSGMDNNCEICMCDRDQIAAEHYHLPECDHNCKRCPDGILKTKPEVLHAESNAITKCAKYGRSTEGAKMYVTCSPCIECAKLIIQAGIKELIYKETYHDTSGLELLKKCNVKIRKLEDYEKDI